ncbi:MAG: universal stress protein [Capsulimonadaceae bacterium]
MFNRILLATDGACHSLHAAEAAGRLARDLGADLTVLFVYTPIATVTPFAAVPGGDLDPSVVESVEDSVMSRTCAVIDRLEVPYTRRCEVGSVPEIICAIADQEDYDLLVIGGSGHGILKTLLLGSTCDRITHTAHCAVMVVK